MAFRQILNASASPNRAELMEMQPYREFREDMQFEMGFKDWLAKQKPAPKEIEMPNIYAQLY